MRGTLVAAKRRWKAAGRKGRYLMREKFWPCIMVSLRMSEKPSHSRAKHTPLRLGSFSFMLRKLSYSPCTEKKEWSESGGTIGEVAA